MLFGSLPVWGGGCSSSHAARLSGVTFPTDWGGCKSSTSEQAKLGAEEPRGYVQRVWQFAAPILRAV